MKNAWRCGGCGASGNLHSCLRVIRGLSTERARLTLWMCRLMGADYAAINFNGLVDGIEARTVEEMLMWY